MEGVCALILPQGLVGCVCVCVYKTADQKKKKKKIRMPM